MEGNSSAVVTAPLTNGQATAPAIKIDKGVPIPPPLQRGIKPGTPLVWLPWRQMQVGDSFLFPWPAHLTVEEARHRAASRIAERHKRGAARFLTRITIEDDERVVRVWRVS